ncbi:MAG: hypothetical protein D6695_09005 [Planctomycetota bacterium]|nr:MAG: hypothetical protein D6695_09005 [Planctomycetota bacterium]
MLKVTALVFLGVLGGCASVWERGFEARAGVVRKPLDDEVAVEIRQAPWARVEQALVELSEMWEQSDEPYEQWPEERKREADAKLLRALQVTDPPESVEIVGRSSFKTTDRIRPHDGRLARFARQIGADRAIWASRYVGKSDRVESRPVHSTGYRRVTYYDRRADKYRTRYEYDDWTTYVPVVVSADETAWVVYFLRRR